MASVTCSITITNAYTCRPSDACRAAFASGAIGGKVSGAGGGGFMMFIVPPERRIGVIQALNGAGGEAASIHLTARGAESWRVARAARSVTLPHLGVAA